MLESMKEKIKTDGGEAAWTPIYMATIHIHPNP